MTATARAASLDVARAIAVPDSAVVAKRPRVASLDVARAIAVFVGAALLRFALLLATRVGSL